jgi:DNA-directed RNA polymerase specialized sigma24 family protein
MTENVIVKQLQEIAGKLTADPDLQKDLMQEMFVHLVRIQTAGADQPLGWCLKSCEFHARNYLKPGSNIDLPMPPFNGAPGDEIPHENDNRLINGVLTFSPLAAPIEIQGELITNDIVNLMLPLLSDRQQQVLFLLMKGCGIRQAARELGVTHPAVIKHRKKIARIAHKFLQDSTNRDVAISHGTNRNGNGKAFIN